MAYSGLYTPVQNAINSLNTQFNINADRDQARQAQGLKNLMAMDQMESRALDRKLAQGSARRAERQMEMEEESMTFRQKRAIEQDRIAKEQYELARPGLEKQAAIARAALVPRNINLYSVLPNSQASRDHLFKNTDAGLRIAEHMGGQGASFDPDSGGLINKAGQPIQLTDVQTSQLLPGAFGILQSYSDPMEMDGQNLLRMEKAVQEKRAGLKDIKKFEGRHLPPGQFKLAERAVRDAEGQLEAAKNKPAYSNIQKYEERQQTIDNFMLQAARAGTNAQTLQVMQHASKQNSGILQQLYKDKAKALFTDGESAKTQQRIIHKLDKDGNILVTAAMNVPKTKGGVQPGDVDSRYEGFVFEEHHDALLKAPKGSNTAEWNSGVRLVENAFGKHDEEGQFVVTPGLRESYLGATRMYQKLFREPGITYDQAAVMARDKVLKMESEYWEKVDEIAKKHKLNMFNDDDMDKIHNTIKNAKIGKVWQKRFGYLPTKRTAANFGLE